MGKLTKILLVLAIASLALGVAFVSNLIDTRGAVACYVVLPAGAIFLGLFLISLLMEKESALYDADHRTSRGFTPQAAPAPRKGPRESSKLERKPVVAAR